MEEKKEDINELPKPEKKKDNPWIAVSIALMIVTGALIYSMVFPANPATTITKEKALADTVEYINANLLPQDITAIGTGVDETSGVYVISIEVEGQQFNSYVSKDGKYLFTQGIDMKQPIPTTEIAQEPLLPEEQEVIKEPSDADVSEPQPSDSVDII